MHKFVHVWPRSIELCSTGLGWLSLSVLWRTVSRFLAQPFSLTYRVTHNTAILFLTRFFDFLYIFYYYYYFVLVFALLFCFRFVLFACLFVRLFGGSLLRRLSLTEKGDPENCRDRFTTSVLQPAPWLVAPYVLGNLSVSGGWQFFRGAQVAVSSFVADESNYIRRFFHDCPYCTRRHK